MRSTNNTRTLQQTKSVSFASQAEVGPAAGAIWYSTEELSSLCTNCPTNYHYHADTDAIDAILDAQEILDGVGVADVASQANILAAVSAKCSAKARHRAYANAKKIHASCYYLGLPSDSSSLHAPEETIPQSLKMANSATRDTTTAKIFLSQLQRKGCQQCPCRRKYS